MFGNELMKRIIKNMCWSTHLLFVAMLLLSGCGLFAPNHDYKGSILEPPMPIDGIALTQTNGSDFDLNVLSGDIVLVYFGYTFCPDFCPLTLHKASQAVSQLETDQDRIHIIFVSVDPERDTPEAIETYLTSFEDISEANLIGLTGSWTDLEQVMKPFGAFAAKEDASGSAANYLVSHTTRLYVLNTAGEWLLHYPFEARAEDIQADLSFLVSQLD